MLNLHTTSRAMRRSVMLAAVGAVVTIAACSSDSEPLATGPGVRTQITGVTRGAGGFEVTVVMTNADTGAIGYSPYCPGAPQVRRAEVWQFVDSTSACRLTEKVLAPGDSLVFTESLTGVNSGDDVRNISHWSYFNGMASGDAISAPATVR